MNRPSPRALAAVLLLAGLLAGLLGAAGCRQQSAPEPRVTLGLHRVKIQGHELEVEIAADPTRRQVGLMYRKTLPAESGMLFVFPQPQPQSFWMSNCLMDIDIAYIDDDGKIVDVIHMKKPAPGTPSSALERYPSSRPVRYALETNAGWFAAKGIGPGAVVEGYRGPADLRVQ